MEEERCGGAALESRGGEDGGRGASWRGGGFCGEGQEELSTNAAPEVPIV